MIKFCECCEKEYKTSKNKQRFCSKSCATKNRNKEDIGLIRTEVDDFIKSYIIGLIVSDGCITSNGEREYIVISLKEEYMIRKIRDLVCPTKKVYKDGNNFQVRWRNEKDIIFLKSIGIVPRKSLTIKWFEMTNMWDYLRGVFDGDGSVYINKTLDCKHNKEYYYLNIKFTSGSYDFAKGLYDFLNTNNIHAKINKDSRRDIYYISIQRQDDIKNFYYKIYENSKDWKLERKYNKFTF